MRTRHKPPTLVSMWMLDVFCCALGCVTLLWLLGNRDAADKSKQFAAATAELEKTRSTLISTSSDLDTTRKLLQAQIDDLKAKLLARTTERDDQAQLLAVAKSDIASLETKLAKSTTQAKLTQEELAKKQKEAMELIARIAASTEASEELRKLLRNKETEQQALTAKVLKTVEQLNDADARIRAMAKANDDAKADLAAMRKSGDELTSSRAMVKDLQKKLDDANANIIDLQGDKKKLADKFDKLRIESDAKFAGIAMTGRRVVFVVDISGSMKLIDENTPAPQKWGIVVETITKVMRSLPELEQFQVVLFSRQARYLFGNGEWQRFTGEESLKVVREKLLTVDPVGDTNLYEGFDLAFRLKSSGLDTIYLFSDGLPTSGVGLPVDTKTLSDSQRTDLLTRAIRQMLRTQWNPSGGSRVKINAVGFFFESPEVGAFLWALARENAGSFVGMSSP